MLSSAIDRLRRREALFGSMARANLAGNRAFCPATGCAVAIGLWLAAWSGGCGSSESSAQGAELGGVVSGSPATAQAPTSGAAASSGNAPSSSSAGRGERNRGGAGAAAASGGDLTSVGTAAMSGGASGAGGSGVAADRAANAPAGAAASAGKAAAGAAADSGGNGAAGAMASSGAAGAGPEPASCKAAQGQAPVIYIIGDSTAAVYAKDKYPAMGWAQPLQEYFEPACATVQDKAINGRSSKSFFDEGSWTPVRTALRPGDFVLIQFGHNDEKREDAARFTEPFGSYQQQLSVYIDETLAAKATPVLLTSIERNKWSGDKLSSTHGDYPEAVRQLAQKRQLTLVDMTELTHAYLERIGQAAAGELYMHLAPGEYPAYPDGVTDDTHLQDKGAHAFAELALADLARQRAPIALLLERVPTP